MNGLTIKNVLLRFVKEKILKFFYLEIFFMNIDDMVVTIWSYKREAPNILGICVGI